MTDPTVQSREAALSPELIARSRVDPVLHLALTRYLMGDCTLELAMTRAALHLSATCEAQREELVERISRCTCKGLR